MEKIEDKDIELYIDRETLLQEYIPKADYETRLKADMVAILTELKSEIDEMQCLYVDFVHYVNEYDVSNLIQQKINALKENKDANI